MGFFRNLSQQLRQVWQGMSAGRRIGLVVVGLLTAAVVLGVGYWAAQPDYRVLFSGLAVEDAGAITSKLQAQGISYRLAGGGTSILVPADQLQQVRIEMATEGYPVKGGKGFELFDQSPLGMTPFTQHVNYTRALQAELARTIMQIEPVAFARVHIVRSDPSPFLRDQKPTTASVMLRLKPGSTLNRQVAGSIVALVSRSVEGLQREHVTLIDAQGRLLSEEHNPETGLSGSPMDHRRELEKYLSSQAESMLASVVGPGRALVRVTADVNFQRHREKKETYNPEGRVVVSEKISNTKSTSASSGARGPAGTSSNLGKGGSGAGPGANSQEESIQTDFAVSKVTQEYEDKLGGTINRLTIAALVDLAPDKDAKSDTPRMPLADVQDIIKQAVGFKAGRDEIKVTNVKLAPLTAPSGPDEEWEKIQSLQTIVSIVRYASLGIAALAAVFMVWMVMRKVRPGPETAPPAATEEKNPTLARLSTAANQDPQAIAKILSHWLDQSERPRRQAA